MAEPKVMTDEEMFEQAKTDHTGQCPRDNWTTVCVQDVVADVLSAERARVAELCDRIEALPTKSHCYIGPHHLDRAEVLALLKEIRR